MKPPAGGFDLLLFSTDEEEIHRAVAAGIDGVIVDWETRGKRTRQAGADTEINSDTPDDLRRARRATRGRVICRVHGPREANPDEIEAAIDGGADEILLPMVRCRQEVEHVLEQVSGRCQVGMLIETVEAVSEVETFRALPLSRVYVGLNDLAIARGTANIFRAVIDGTVERLRPHVTAPFGFGGLTLPERGSPVPCSLLMDEMVRLDCGFSFLRRSFHRDARGLEMTDVIARIRRGLSDAQARVQLGGTENRAALEQAIASWDLVRAAAG